MRFSFRWRLADDGKRSAVSVWHQAGRLGHLPSALIPLFLNISESLLFLLFLNTSESLLSKTFEYLLVVLVVVLVVVFVVVAPSSSARVLSCLCSLLSPLFPLPPLYPLISLSPLFPFSSPLSRPLVCSRAVVVFVVVGGPFEYLPNGLLSLLSPLFLYTSESLLFLFF